MEVITIKELAAMLGLHDRDHRAILRLISHGLLTPVPGLKRPRRFTRENVEAFLRGETSRTPTPKRRPARTAEPEWLKDVPRVFRTGKKAAPPGGG